jgi:Tfp pilus assembly protein PilN
MRAVNLIPAEDRGGTSVGVGRSEGGAYAVLVLVAGLALLAFLYGRADKQISSRRAQVATLTTQVQHAQAAVAQLGPYTSFIAMREQRANAVANLVDSRFDWAHVFHEFGRVLPVSVSITSLSGTVGTASGASGSSSSTPGSAAGGAATVSSATPPGTVPIFTITGCATSQPAVAQMLTRLRLIDGVANVTLQTSAKSGVSGAGSAGAGGCEGNQPAFTASVVFSPLPTAAATHSATAAASPIANRSSTAATGGAR